MYHCLGGHKLYELAILAGHNIKVKNAFCFKLDAMSVRETLETTIRILLRFSIVLADRQRDNTKTQEKQPTKTKMKISVLDEVLLEDNALVAQIDSPAIKDALRAATDQAVEAGVFGVPAFAVNDELIWGQDRMHFVEKIVKELRPS